jgi:hypothetical protein
VIENVIKETTKNRQSWGVKESMEPGLTPFRLACRGRRVLEIGQLRSPSITQGNQAVCGSYLPFAGGTIISRWIAWCSALRRPTCHVRCSRFVWLQQLTALERVVLTRHGLNVWQVQYVITHQGCVIIVTIRSSCNNCRSLSLVCAAETVIRG